MQERDPAEGGGRAGPGVEKTKSPGPRMTTWVGYILIWNKRKDHSSPGACHAPFLGGSGSGDLWLGVAALASGVSHSTGGHVEGLG